MVNGYKKITQEEINRSGNTDILTEEFKSSEDGKVLTISGLDLSECDDDLGKILNQSQFDSIEKVIIKNNKLGRLNNTFLHQNIAGKDFIIEKNIIKHLDIVVPSDEWLKIYIEGKGKNILIRLETQDGEVKKENTLEKIVITIDGETKASIDISGVKNTEAFNMNFINENSSIRELIIKNSSLDVIDQSLINLLEDDSSNVIRVGIEIRDNMSGDNNDAIYLYKVLQNYQKRRGDIPGAYKSYTQYLEEFRKKQADSSSRAILNVSKFLSEYHTNIFLPVYWFAGLFGLFILFSKCFSDPSVLMLLIPGSLIPNFEHFLDLLSEVDGLLIYVFFLISVFTQVFVGILIYEFISTARMFSRK